MGLYAGFISNLGVSRGEQNIGKVVLYPINQ